MSEILIAEDEDILRRNLTYILNSSGYATMSARSTVDAIELLKKKEFDLVITDLVMPVKGGSELIKYIFDNHPDIAVIIITAYPSTDSAIHAVKSGVFDYFTKPFKTEDMISAVKKALERNKKVPFIWDRLAMHNVTKRETGLLKLVIEDGIAENKEIADKLSIKVTTVKQHFENLYNKFGTNNRTSLISAVIKALRN